MLISSLPANHMANLVPNRRDTRQKNNDDSTQEKPVRYPDVAIF
jgi:hypothetical protein